VPVSPRTMPEPLDPLERLEADGLLRRDGDVIRTTRRWQAAMARAALHLLEASRADPAGDSGADLRVPVAYAVVELYGARLSDAEVVSFVEALLPVEARELAPRP
jgi:hypothetical protein